MAGTYETVQGDTWDKIAYQVYGDEKYAGYLMENNRLLLEYLVFPGGVTLATPDQKSIMFGKSNKRTIKKKNSISSAR